MNNKVIAGTLIVSTCLIERLLKAVSFLGYGRCTSGEFCFLYRCYEGSIVFEIASLAMEKASHAL